MEPRIIQYKQELEGIPRGALIKVVGRSGYSQKGHFVGVDKKGNLVMYRRGELSPEDVVEEIVYSDSDGSFPSWATQGIETHLSGSSKEGRRIKRFIEEHEGRCQQN